MLKLTVEENDPVILILENKQRILVSVSDIQIEEKVVREPRNNSPLYYHHSDHERPFKKSVIQKYTLFLKIEAPQSIKIYRTKLLNEIQENKIARLEEEISMLRKNQKQPIECPKCSELGIAVPMHVESESESHTYLLCNECDFESKIER